MFTDLKLSGSLTMEGGQPDMRQMIRVYYSFTDSLGETEENCLGTFFITCSSPTYESYKLVSKLDCFSTLYPLSTSFLSTPKTFFQGENPMNIIRSILLPYNLADEETLDMLDTGYRLSNPHTFDAGTSNLEIINYMFDVCGYGSAIPNAYGKVSPLADSTVPPTPFIFKDNETSIIYPQVNYETNFYDVPNFASLFYSGEDEAIWATAKNVDPASDVSIPSIGYEKSYYKEVNELAGDTTQDRINNLKATARACLIDNSRQVNYCTVKHPYLPLGINYNCNVQLSQEKDIFKGKITSMSIDLTPGCPTTTKIRRYAARSFDIITDGGWLIKKEDE